MRTNHTLDRLIYIVAPKSHADFWVKAATTNVLIAFTFTLLEFWLLGDGTFNLANHITGILVISIPLSCFGLAAIWYLNTLRNELIHLATTDLLTGLRNRRAFMDAAGQAASRSRGILMMLDLDYFKRVNDTYGHTVGDDCLRAVADVLREQVRVDDIVGRLGGEEFAIFLLDAPIEDARLIGERLCAGAEINLADADGVLNITASVGAVEMPENDDLDTVLKLADLAMYQAKDAGRARLVFWEKGFGGITDADPV